MNQVSQDRLMAIILVIVMGAGIFYQAGKRLVLQREIQTLKAEIAEWQRSAMPAIHARGWEMSITRVEDLKSENLANALNPCVDAQGEIIKTESCAFNAKYSVLSKIPIKITFAP